MISVVSKILEKDFTLSKRLQKRRHARSVTFGGIVGNRCDWLLGSSKIMLISLVNLWG